MFFFLCFFKFFRLFFRLSPKPVPARPSIRSNNKESLLLLLLPVGYFFVFCLIFFFLFFFLCLSSVYLYRFFSVQQRPIANDAIDRPLSPPPIRRLHSEACTSVARDSPPSRFHYFSIVEEFFSARNLTVFSPDQEKREEKRDGRKVVRGTALTTNTLTTRIYSTDNRMVVIVFRQTFAMTTCH